MTSVPRLLTIFVLLMLPTVVSLGFWQLRRAEEKLHLETEFRRQLLKPVRSPATEIGPFERISLQGQWASTQFLVDNQIRDGRVGYWVIQTFVASDGRTFLINRGWTRAPATRQELPEVETPAGMQRVTALAWPQLGLQPVWGEDDWVGTDRIRVQSRDIGRMSQLTGAYPMELRLESGSPGGLDAAPQDVDFGRATHLGYAVQWFGLGVVLVAGYFVVYRKSRQKTEIPDE